MAAPSTPPCRRQLERNDSTEKNERPEGPPRKRVRGKSSSPLKSSEADVAEIVAPIEKVKVLMSVEPNSDQHVDDIVVTADTADEDALSEVFPLVGRENECAALEDFLQSCLGDGVPAKRCLYVSGGPGTGKTCSSRAAARQWSQANILEVNCMGLSTRSVAGLSDQLAQRCIANLGTDWKTRLGRQGSPTAAALEALRQVKGPTIVIVDEVDQLVPRGCRGRSSAGDLDDLVALTQQEGVPPIAIILIANAVDLLTRSNLGLGGCPSLLFKPYNKDQLRQIIKARLATSEGNAAVDPTTLEVRIRQVAKQSGDCRQAMSMCEEVLFKSATATGPVKLSIKSSDTFQASDLPMEQMVLLGVLASSESNAVKIADVCIRYKKTCRDLRQPVNLGTKAHVNNALAQLEQRGLLSLRMARGNTQVAELAITRDKVRQTMPGFLQHCLNLSQTSIVSHLK